MIKIKTKQDYDEEKEEAISKETWKKEKDGESGERENDEIRGSGEKKIEE